MSKLRSSLLATFRTPLSGAIGAASFTPSQVDNLLLLKGGVSQAITQWTNQATIWPSFIQDVATYQPVLSGTELQFDGNDNYMKGAYVAGSPTKTVLPDGAGSNVLSGKGITGVGMTVDPDGSLWVANYGKSSSGEADPFDCTIMNINATTKALITEITGLNTTFTSLTSSDGIQGVTYDTSDDTLWFVSDTNNTVYHVSKAGADLGDEFSVDAGTNSVAYDATNDYLLVYNTNTGVIKRYNAATQAYVDTVVTLPTYTNADQIAFDDTNDIIWVTHGTNSNPMQIRAYCMTTGALSDPIYLPSTLAAEGVVFDYANNKLYVTSDESFHPTAENQNQIHTYDFDASGVIEAVTTSYTKLTFTMVFDVDSAPASETLFASANPLTGYGLGFFVPTGALGTFRVIIYDGSTTDTLDFSLATSMTTKTAIQVEIDFANKSVTLSQNNTALTPQSYDAALPASWAYNYLTLAALPDLTRELDVNIDHFGVSTSGFTSGQKADYQTWLEAAYGI